MIIARICIGGGLIMQQLYERALFDPGCEEVKELETEEPNRTDCFYGYFLFEFHFVFLAG